LAGALRLEHLVAARPLVHPVQRPAHRRDPRVEVPRDLALQGHDEAELPRANLWIRLRHQAEQKVARLRAFAAGRLEERQVDHRAEQADPVVDRAADQRTEHHEGAELREREPPRC
jgi:hypothetical protein